MLSPGARTGRTVQTLRRGHDATIGCEKRACAPAAEFVSNMHSWSFHGARSLRSSYRIASVQDAIATRPGPEETNGMLSRTEGRVNDPDQS